MRTRRGGRAVLTWLCVATCVGTYAPAAAQALVGDCDGDGRVTVSELVNAVGIALGAAPLDRCPAVDDDGNGQVSIDELVRGVAAALGGEPSETPTPGVAVFDLFPIGGQPCGATTFEFGLAADAPAAVSATVTDFCVDAAAFDVAAVTCVANAANLVVDAVEIQSDCALDAGPEPRGQVRVTAHADSGAFAPGDSFSCRVPVLAEAQGGDYPVPFRVRATTATGEISGAGTATVTVFGLANSDRSQGECCARDAQCGSGFCRGGNANANHVCCESDCPTGVCNGEFFPGACCAADDLTCDPPP